MNRNDLRRVEWKYEKFAINEPETKTNTGYFHKWSEKAIDTYVNNYGESSGLTAIVETEEGKTCLIDSKYIKFTNSELESDIF